MNILVTVYYYLRRLWFNLFPRKVGKRGWTPSKVSALLPAGALPPGPATWRAPRLKWGMLGNDQYGDCVYAAIAHAIMAVGAFVKRARAFTAAQVIAGYFKWNNGNDTGVFIDQLLVAWATDEITNTPIDPFGVGGPFVKLDPKNPQQIKEAIATFGWVIVGSNLQQAQEYQFSRGQRWDYVPGSKVVGGHGVCLLGYDSRGVGPFVVSWARGFRATWAWVTNTCDEAYTGVLPPHLAALRYVEPLVKLDEYCSQLPRA